MPVDRASKTGREPAGRRALVLAAEHLVAKYGVEGFTVRMLNDQAGARNASALYYHFETREGLIRAVWEHRMSVIDPERLRLLDGLTCRDTAHIIDAIVVPLADQIKPAPAGGAYLRFLERVWRAGVYEQEAFSNLPFTTSWRMAYDLLREGLAGTMPADLIEMKIRLVRTLIVSGLAGIEADIESGKLRAKALSTATKMLRDSAIAILRSTSNPAA